MSKIRYALAIMLFAASSAHANLIVNGSFEATNQANGTWQVYKNIPGWTTVSGPGIEIRNNIAGAAQNGKNYVELDSHNGKKTNSAMQQTIATQAGTLYDLSFWYSPRIHQPSKTNPINVYWNNSLLGTYTGTGGNTNIWTNFVLSVLGTGNDILKFAAAGIDDSYGGNIDNVSLKPSKVPAPAAIWLMATAMGFMGFSRRKSV